MLVVVVVFGAWVRRERAATQAEKNVKNTTPTIHLEPTLAYSTKVATP